MRVRLAGIVAIVVLSGVTVPGLAQGSEPATPTPAPTPAPNPCVGTIQTPATGTTVVSVQGWPHDGGDFHPRLVGVGPNGTVRWVYRPENATWAYDVDPVGDGRLFGIATFRKDGDPRTRLFLLDVPSRSVVWTETLDIADTHDADILGPHRILIANMRAFHNGTSHDRIAVYNRTSGEFVWSWYFRNHYPASMDDGMRADEDWTHLNDVDRIGPGRYLASPRNFDQVIVVDRSTGDIDLRLGRDGRHRILNNQHNPVYLRGEGDRPTLLVADSENDRVVEYARTSLGWQRTWRLQSPQWVRDADRLPGGNTLVTASEGNRVMEVAPNGTVVWEFYAPWLPYDTERIPYGDEPEGPTIAEQDATGTVRLSGDTDPSTARLEACARFLRSVDSNWTRRANAGGNASTSSWPSTAGATPTASTRTPSAVTATGSPTRAATPTLTPTSDDPGGVTTTGIGPPASLLGVVLVVVALVGAALWRRAR